MLQQPLRASQGYSAPIPTLQHVESLGFWGGPWPLAHIWLYSPFQRVCGCYFFLSFTHVYTHTHLCKST